MGTQSDLRVMKQIRQRFERSAQEFAKARFRGASLVRGE